MKKILLFILAGILLCSVCLSNAAGASRTGRTITLMIYMCGSNLESDAGAASDDLKEMVAGMGSNQVNVIVMTGGSRSWHTDGIQSDAIQLHSITSSGIHHLSVDGVESTPGNMGESATLTRLIDYSVSNYPASRYALILWDHGSGPMGGVCADEWHDMDMLTLDEIVSALEASKLPGKLDWIGFDACLMGTLEVACAVQPYAQYMIASQSTEPGYGWNYSFLKQLDRDQNGADTGKRIVDAYFDQYIDLPDTLTMSCINLGQLTPLLSEMDAFFGPIADGITEEQFPNLYRQSLSTIGFGRAASSDEISLDLVDLGDLVLHIEDVSGHQAALLDALNNAVVCSRSNRSGINGISVYHPLQNTSHTTDWQEQSDRTNGSTGYRRYIQAFSQMLTSRGAVNWAGMQTVLSEKDENGVLHFSVQLTEEQARSFSSGRLMILSHETSLKQDGGYIILTESDAVLDENNMLHASFDGKLLYAADSSGNIYGPLSPSIRSDGSLAIRAYCYARQTSWNPDENRSDTVKYILENNSDTEEPVIDRILILDRTAGVYSSRLSYDEERYHAISFGSFGKMMPDLRGIIPAYSEWTNQHWIDADLNLPAEWHFVRTKDLTGQEDLTAIFEITDVHQISCCSLPLHLGISGAVSFTVNNPYLGNDDVLVELSGEVVNAPLQKAVILNFDITNRTSETQEYFLWKPCLNQTRTFTDQDNELTALLTIEPNSTSRATMVIDGSLLSGIDEITQVDVNLIVGLSFKNEGTLTYHLSDCDITAITPKETVLAETEVKGITWQLMDIRQDAEGDFDLSVRIANRTGMKFDPYFPVHAINIDGVQLDGNHFGLYTDTEAGENLDLIIHLTNTELYSTFDIEGEWATEQGESYTKIALTDRILQRHGIHEIRQLSFEYQDRNQMVPVTLSLNEPWIIPDDSLLRTGESWYGTLPDFSEMDAQELTSVADTDQYTLKLERVYVGNRGIAVCMEATNKTDDVLDLKVGSVLINRQNTDIRMDGHTELKMLPHTTAVWTFTFPKILSPGEKPENLEFSIYAKDSAQRDTVVTLTLPEGVTMGKQNGKGIEASACTVCSETDPIPETTDLFKFDTQYVRTSYEKKGKKESPTYIGYDQYVIFHPDGTATYMISETSPRTTQWKISGNQVSLYALRRLIFTKDGDNLIARQSEEVMDFTDNSSGTVTAARSGKKGPSSGTSVPESANASAFDFAKFYPALIPLVFIPVIILLILADKRKRQSFIADQSLGDCSEQDREEFSRFMRLGYTSLYIAGGIAIITGIIAFFVIRSGSSPVFCLIFGLGISLLIIGVWISSSRDFSKFYRSHTDKGDLDRIINDFSKADSWFKNTVRTGENEIYLSATPENILPYESILNLHQYIHKTNGVEDRRALRAVISGGKTIDIGNLKRMGASNDELMRFLTFVASKNPKVTLGYDKAREVIRR